MLKKLSEMVLNDFIGPPSVVNWQFFGSGKAWERRALRGLVELVRSACMEIL